MNIYYVYAYLRSKDSDNAAAGTPYYIGKGSNNRIYERHSVNIPPDSNNIVMLAENLTEAEAFDKEREMIAQWGRLDLGTGILYNRSDGGEGPSGYVHTEDARKRIGENQAGKSKHTLTTREKISQKAKERWANKDFKNKASKQIQEAMARPEVREKTQRNSKAQSESAEFRQKMSEKARNRSADHQSKLNAAMKANWQDPDFVAKQRQALLAAVQTAEARDKMSQRARNRTAEHQARLNEALRQRWADPQYRERMKARASEREQQRRLAKQSPDS